MNAIKLNSGEHCLEVPVQREDQCSTGTDGTASTQKIHQITKMSYICQKLLDDPQDFK